MIRNGKIINLTVKIFIYSSGAKYERDYKDESKNGKRILSYTDGSLYAGRDGSFIFASAKYE